MKDILLIGLIVGLIVWLLKKLGPIGIAVAALGYITWFFIPTETNDNAPAEKVEISDSDPAAPVDVGDNTPADSIESSDRVPADPAEISDSVLIEPAEIDNEVKIKKRIYFVNTGRLNVRSKPGVSGKVVDFIDKGQKIEVLETKGDWARISQYFDGEGLVSTGDVALWVYAVHLSTDRPDATRAEDKTISIVKD